MVYFGCNVWRSHLFSTMENCLVSAMKSLMSFLIAVALTLSKLSCKGCKVVWPLCFLHSREQWLFCPCIVLVLGAVYSTILLTGQRFNSGHLAFQLVTQKCCHTKYWQVAGAYSMLFWVQRQTQSCWQRLLCTDIEAGFHLENMSRFDVPRSHSIVMLSYPWYLYTVHEGLFAVIWPHFLTGDSAKSSRRHREGEW